ncbi:hypothetical protein JOQ06_029028, partial [Pogonophryne albipinna]
MDQVDRLSINGLPLESKTPAQAREELLREIRISAAIQRGLACSRPDLHVENYTSTRSRASTPLNPTSLCLRPVDNQRGTGCCHSDLPLGVCMLLTTPPAYIVDGSFGAQQEGWTDGLTDNMFQLVCLETCGRPARERETLGER